MGSSGLLLEKFGGPLLSFGGPANLPYLFTHKAHHFLRENMLVRWKSAQNSGCVL